MPHIAAMIHIVLPLTCIILTVYFLRKKLDKKLLIILSLVYIWIGLFANYLSNEIITVNEPITITALGTHNPESQGNEVTVTGLTLNGQSESLDAPQSGKWIAKEVPDGTGNVHYSWISDEGKEQDITSSITFEIPVGTNRKLTLILSGKGGEVETKVGATVQKIDTYGSDMEISFALEDSSKSMIRQKKLKALPAFLIISGVASMVVFLSTVFITTQKQRDKFEKYKFLFSELVKRDFILKYKRTILGILWSVLSPLSNLLIMWLVFGKMLGSNINHYAVYLFIGQIVFAYFSEATGQGMTALLDNASIFTKINVPKYMFLLSKNVSSLINFMINVGILFVFIIVDKIAITQNFIMLVFPLVCMIVFNLGVGLMLSALFVFFRDMQYLWGIVCQLLMWLSAIFYPIDQFPELGRNLFLLNPMYLFIRYTRKIVIDNTIPSIWFHLLMISYALIVLITGAWMYKKYNHEFLYYV